MSSDQVRQKLAAVQRNGSKHLDLSDSNLDHLPPEIGDAWTLESLDLSGNSLATLPDELGRLYLLEDIDVSRNQLVGFPAAITRLRQLKSLRLSANALSSVPAQLGSLLNLNTLDLSSNQLRSLPVALSRLVEIRLFDVSSNPLASLRPMKIEGLQKLKYLDISGTLLSELPLEITLIEGLGLLSIRGCRMPELPPAIGNLVNIETLDVSDNELQVLPESIGELQYLRSLTARNNNLTGLPGSIASLAKLKSIDVSSNEITKLPNEIGQLSDLERLDLSHNILDELPSSLGSMRRLHELDVSNNSLSDLPSSLGRLRQIGSVHLDGNQLPREMFTVLDRQGLAALLDYLLERSEGSSRTGQAKVLVLGEGGVGKTSLVAQLKGDGFVDRPRTHGIELGSASVVDEGAAYDLRFWDFGGQEVYQLTHQFFYSPDSLYLVVWHAREGLERGDVYGWLERIRFRVGDSAKILLVATHSDGLNPQVDLDDLQEFAGGTIVGRPFAVDNATGLNIDDLRKEIARQVRALGVADREWPDSFKELYGRFHSSSEPQIPWRDFTSAGKQLGLGEPECESAAIQMTVAGRLTYFKDAALQGKVILQPDWLTRAISSVLDDTETARCGGVISAARLAELWTATTVEGRQLFSKEDVPFLLELIEQYGVGFRLAAPASSSFLISQLVPSERPKDLGLPDLGEVPVKRVRCDLPTRASKPGLIAGLTSRLHNFATGTWWTNGVVLCDANAGAWAVVQLRGSNSLLVTVYGERSDDFFAFLRSSIESRVAEWPGLTPSYHVLCPKVREDGQLCTHSWAQEELATKYHHGVATEFCPSCLTPDVSIAELLGRMPTATQADQTDRVLDAIEEFSKQHAMREAAVLDRLEELEAGLLEAVDKLGVDQYTLFRALLLMVGREVVDTPRLAAIDSITRSQYLPNDWFSSKFELQLWCEHVGHEHPAGHRYKFSRSREWFVRAQPYLRWVSAVLKLAPLSRHALALAEEFADGGPSTTLPVAPQKPTGGSYSAAELAVVRKSIQVVETVGSSATELARSAPYRPSVPPSRTRNGDVRLEYNPPSLRELRLLLHEIGAMKDGVLVHGDLRLTPPSPTAILGAGPTSITGDGFPLWICEAHWPLYSAAG